MNRPTAAKGHMPFPGHRTQAEVSKGDVSKEYLAWLLANKR